MAKLMKEQVSLTKEQASNFLDTLDGKKLVASRCSVIFRNSDGELHTLSYNKVFTVEEALKIMDVTLLKSFMSKEFLTIYV